MVAPSIGDPIFVAVGGADGTTVGLPSPFNSRARRVAPVEHVVYLGGEHMLPSHSQLSVS
jgi:hypothetical protein